MEKREIISIAGELASGKGVISTIMAERLNYGIYRNGEYFRKLAKEHNMDVTNFNIYVKEHPEIDFEIERSASEYAKTHNKFIIDARLGWYAVPESFKVYLTVNIDEAARRAFYDEKRKQTEKFETLEEQKQDLIKRYQLENERYWKIYKVRKEELSNYDFILDTTKGNPEKLAEEIINAYQKWLHE